MVTQRYFGPTRSLAARSAATLKVAASEAAHEHPSPTGGRAKRVVRMGRSGGCEVGKGGAEKPRRGCEVAGRSQAGGANTIHVCRATARARGSHMKLPLNCPPHGTDHVFAMCWQVGCSPLTFGRCPVFVGAHTELPASFPPGLTTCSRWLGREGAGGIACGLCSLERPPPSQPCSPPCCSGGCCSILGIWVGGVGGAGAGGSHGDLQISHEDLPDITRGPAEIRWCWG